MNEQLKQYFPEFETMDRVVYATADLSNLTFGNGFEEAPAIAQAEIVAAEFPVAKMEASRSTLTTVVTMITGLLS